MRRPWAPLKRIHKSLLQTSNQQTCRPAASNQQDSRHTLETLHWCLRHGGGFLAWALPGIPKSSPNHIKIHPKSTQNHQKLVLGMALGTPGLPLEASWAPLGGRMPKTIKKVTWRTPPRRCQRRSFLSIFRYFLGYCFWYQFLYHF